MNISEAKILIIATNGFEQSELEVPLKRLKELGAQVQVASPESGSITGWQGKDWGNSVNVDLPLDDVDAEDFHVLVLPGGQINPDLLRVNSRVINIIKQFNEDHKPIAAICHAPWLLIEAGLIKGIRATSYQSIATDMKNAGANWEDAEVVCDGNIITSRQPGDLDAFVGAIQETIAELEFSPG